MSPPSQRERVPTAVLTGHSLPKPALSLDSSLTLATLTPRSESPSTPTSNSPDTLSFSSDLKGDRPNAQTQIRTQNRYLILSFLLSPVGYSFCRPDRRLKRFKGKDPARSSRRLRSAIIDPEEYSEWFRSTTKHDSNTRYPLFSTHPNDLPSASRAAIRGFVLAFVTGTAIDVVLPAILKQKFKGLARKIFIDNASVRSLGFSVGGFAFLYQILFRQLTVLLCEKKNLFNLSTLPRTTNRIDSGIGIQNLDQESSVSEHDGETSSKSMHRRKWLPAMIAAWLASPAYALIPEQTRRLTLALYFLTYAGEVAFAALEKNGYTAWMPSWLGIWILFPISSSQTVHTFINHGDCFPDAFRKVIMSQCSPYLAAPKGLIPKGAAGTYPSAANLLADMSKYLQTGSYNSVPTLPGDALSPAWAAANAGGPSLFPLSEHCLPALRATEGMGHPTALCRLFHPQSGSCSRTALDVAGRNMKWALKLYSTLAVLTFALRGGNVFKNGVKNYFIKTILATIRSAVCTWGMAVTAFPLLCIMDRYLPNNFLPTKRTYVNGFLGGLWILVESQQRQAALTLYYTRFMLESIWRRLVKAGLVKNIRQGETLLFGLSIGVIMGIYESMPQLQRKSFIQSALDKLFRD
ncbi:hypothetical protein BGZ94_006902 [Podila epigama]|nr:hypothetical protein BGZ94_006902 [Podila epigama]